MKEDVSGGAFGHHPSSDHQACGPELCGDLVDGTGDVLGDFGTGADHLTGSEEQDDDLGVIQPVDETGELLGLVLDLLESEGDRDSVEVDLLLEVGRGHDVLDLDLGLDGDLDVSLLQVLRDLADGDFDILAAFGSGTDDLSAPEDQSGGLGLLEPVDETGELLGVVLSTLESFFDPVQVEFLTKVSRGNHVLNVHLCHLLHQMGLFI